MIDYIERENNEARVVNLVENGVDDVTSLLVEDYPYIFEALEEEDYSLDYGFSTFFKEVVYDGRVVGFYVYDVELESEEKLDITEFYVLPEYRGNKIFVNTILDLFYSNKGFLLRNPTRRIINILIDNGLAWKFSKNLVRSIFNFSTMLSEVYINNRIAGLYDDVDYYFGQMTYFGNIFDVNTGCIVFNDPQNLITYMDDVLCLSTPREKEIRKYNLSKKLRKVDKRYMKSLYNTVVRNVLNNEEKSVQVINGLNGNITVERVISDKLIDEFLEEYEEYSFDDLIQFRDDVQKALDDGDISPENILTRFEYLLDFSDWDVDVEVRGACPYCHGDELKKGVCIFCGYNLFDKKISEHDKVIESSFDPDSGLYYSLLETIEEKGLDLDYVFNAQLEIVEVVFLKFLESWVEYPSFPNFDDDFGICEEKYVGHLLEMGLIDSRENPNPDDEKEFLYNMRIEGSVPTLRAYKMHKHRDFVYKINKKGRRYYKKNKCASLFSEYVDKLPYYEFKQFYDEHKTDYDKMGLMDEYLNWKEKKILEEENATEYVDLCLSRALCSRKGGGENYAVDLARLLIVDLNFYLKGRGDEMSEPVSVRSEVLLDSDDNPLQEYDIRFLFDEAYNSIALEMLKFGEELRYDDFRRIINADSIFDINRELMLKYS